MPDFNLIQNGVPKWEQGARVWIYLRKSPAHVSNVNLVFNPKTGHDIVSLQFHVVFDGDFAIVPRVRKRMVPPSWDKLVKGSKEMTTRNLYDLTNMWFKAVPDESAREIQGQLNVE